MLLWWFIIPYKTQTRFVKTQVFFTLLLGFAPVIAFYYSIRGWIDRMNIVNLMSSTFCMLFHQLQTTFFPGILFYSSWEDYSIFNIVVLSYTEGISFSQCDYSKAVFI